MTRHDKLTVPSELLIDWMVHLKLGLFSGLATAVGF
jgi:hypothetical protein